MHYNDNDALRDNLCKTPVKG